MNQQQTRLFKKAWDTAPITEPCHASPILTVVAQPQQPVISHGCVVVFVCLPSPGVLTGRTVNYVVIVHVLIWNVWVILVVLHLLRYHRLHRIRQYRLVLHLRVLS